MPDILASLSHHLALVPPSTFNISLAPQSGEVDNSKQGLTPKYLVDIVFPIGQKRTKHLQQDEDSAIEFTKRNANKITDRNAINKDRWL